MSYKAKQFVTGDLVLVKFPGYGYWPSKITTVLRNGQRKIRCFGENETGLAYIDDMKYYDDNNKKKHLSKRTWKKYPALAEAVRQISWEFWKGPVDWNGMAEGKKNQSKWKKIGNKTKESIIKANNYKTDEDSSISEEAQGDLNQEGETEVFKDRAKKENSDKVEESNTEQTNENINEESYTDNSPYEETCKYEIPENEIMSEIMVDEYIDIEEHQQTEKENNQGPDENRPQEQNECVDHFNPGSSRTIRIQDSSGDDDTNNNSDHQPCVGRNSQKAVNISMRFEMSATTFAQVAPIFLAAITNSHLNVEEG